MRAFFKSGSKAGSSSAGAEGDTTTTTSKTAMSTTSDDGAGSSSTASKTKQSQTRRAQVRSAQIRHRQRKANHTTELEREVGEYRELIAAAERAAAELRGENEGLRRRLVAAGIDPDGDRAGRQQAATDWSGQAVTVTLAVDEAMGTPAFSISSALSDHPSLEQSQPRSSPYNSHDEVWLTMAQEETAINFILSLEHICWNHFHSEHNIAHRVLQTVTNGGTGHTLMASSYCMATAPESIYKDRKALPSSITPEQVACPSMLPPTPPEGTAAAASSSSPAAAASSPSPTLAWSAPHISLQDLRGLASSLNPGDLELTPVQAWFELADRYPVALLVPEGPGSTLATFKKELRGLVKCLHYGAVIEREAFESVVSRIMDPALWEMQQSIGFDFL